MRILLSLATAITILAVALLVLFTPVWTHFALGAVGNGDALPLYWSDQTVNQVLFGPGDFEIDPCFPTVGGCRPDNATQSTFFHLADGNSFYTDDEKGHMRDVRVVFYGFMLLAIVSALFVVVSLVRTPRDVTRWRAVGRGGLWLIGTVIVLGLFGAFAFEAVFTLFHEIFFPGGNWSFPADSNLIRLYPEAFWELSSFTLGGLAIGGALIVWFLARRRAAQLTAA